MNRTKKYPQCLESVILFHAEKDLKNEPVIIDMPDYYTQSVIPENYLPNGDTTNSNVSNDLRPETLLTQYGGTDNETVTDELKRKQSEVKTDHYNSWFKPIMLSLIAAFIAYKIFK